VIGCRNNHECFVVAGELLESVFAEIQRVGFFSVDHQHRTSNFVSESQQRCIDEGERRSLVPVSVGVDGPRMEASRCLVILPVIFYELRFIAGKFIRQTCAGCVGSVFGVFGTLGIQFLLQCIASIFIHLVEIAIGVHTAHVVHSGGDGSFDAGVDCSGVQCKTAESADAEHPDLVVVDALEIRQIIDSCGEIFRTDVRRS